MDFRRFRDLDLDPMTFVTDHVENTVIHNFEATVFLEKMLIIMNLCFAKVPVSLTGAPLCHAGEM